MAGHAAAADQRVGVRAKHHRIEPLLHAGMGEAGSGHSFEAPADGVYWFSVQTVHKSGTKVPEKLEGEAPALVVRVETEKKVDPEKKIDKDSRIQELEKALQAVQGRLDALEKELKELKAKEKQ